MEPESCCLNDGGHTIRTLQKSGHRTRDEAVTALNEVVSSLLSWWYVEPSKLRLEEFLQERWLPATRSRVRPSPLSSYNMLIRHHIAPRLGSVGLRHLTADRLNAFYADLLGSGRHDGNGLSRKTVRNTTSSSARRCMTELR